MQRINELSPNQIVAINLRHSREIRGWSQAETAKLLEPLLGHRMSRQALAEWEKSIDGHKIHHFDADEIVALSRLFEQPAGVWFGPPFVYIKGRVLVNVKGASVKPLTASEMLQLALPQRDERAARAADEWYIKTFIAQVLRWLSQELGRDRPLAERFTSELARSLGLSHQSTEGFKFTRDLLEITADLIQRFSVVQRQRRTDQDDTLMPHEQERAGQEILTLMKTRPDFRVALRDDKPQKDRRGRPPRLSRLTRNRIIKLVNSGKASAAECARKYGISRATVSRLLAGVRSRPG